MKRILKLSTLAGAIVAAVLLTSMAPGSPQTANAQVYVGVNGGYYYNGGYASTYRGYSGYGYSPYGYSGYTYAAPRAYVTPYYSPYGYGVGYDNRYGNTGMFGQSYRAAYNPYGYGGYGPYGY